MSSALERTPYQAVQGVSSHSSERDIIQSMLDMQMDGLILVSPSLPHDQLTELGARIPLVAIGNRPPASTTFDTVNNNDEHSGKLVVSHLVQRGARRISMLSLEAPTAMLKRERGYTEEMKAQGLDAHIDIVRSPQSPRGLYVGVEAILEKSPKRSSAGATRWPSR